MKEGPLEVKRPACLTESPEMKRFIQGWPLPFKHTAKGKKMDERMWNAMRSR
jgi:hypothetical protein